MYISQYLIALSDKKEWENLNSLITKLDIFILEDCFQLLKEHFF